MRDSVSVGPPAGKTLMYFTGLFGQSSAARATPEAIIGAAERATRQHERAPARQHEFFNAGTPLRFISVKPTIHGRHG